MTRLLLLCVLGGCWLTSRAPPVEVRYFSPPTGGERIAAPRIHTRVRLGRVVAAAHLRYRIAHRRSAVEVELYDTMRWTEQPAEYVRRELADALFTARGLDQAVTGEAPTVSIEVLAFEHVERSGHHYGRVHLRYTIDDDRDIWSEQSVIVERSAASSDISAVISAIGDAVHAASVEVASRVVDRLCPPRQ